MKVRVSNRDLADGGGGRTTNVWMLVQLVGNVVHYWKGVPQGQHLFDGVAAWSARRRHWRSHDDQNWMSRSKYPRYCDLKDHTRLLKLISAIVLTCQVEM